jgi:hypothetical protein
LGVGLGAVAARAVVCVAGRCGWWCMCGWVWLGVAGGCGCGWGCGWWLWLWLGASLCGWDIGKTQLAIGKYLCILRKITCSRNDLPCPPATHTPPATLGVAGGCGCSLRCGRRLGWGWVWGLWRAWLWQGVWSAWLAGVAAGGWVWLGVAWCGWVWLGLAGVVGGAVAGGCGCGSGRVCVVGILG